jgi:hypothetical protein
VISFPQRALNKLFLQPIASYVEKMQDGLAKLTAIYQDLREKGTVLKDRVRHFFVYLPNNILNKSSEIFSLFQNRLLQPFMKPLRPLIDWSGEVLKSLSNTVSSTKEKFINFIDRNLYQPCLSAQERIKTWVKEQAKTILQPVADWIDPKLEAARKGWEKAKEKISRLKEKTKENLKAVSESVESSVKKTYQLASETVQQIVQLIPQPVLTLFQPVAALIAAPFNYRRTHKVFKAFMKKVYEKIHSGLRYAEKWIGKGKAAARKLVRRAWKTIKVIPMRLFSHLKRIARVILTALIGSFLLIRLMLAWARALLRYGMLLVREKSRNLLFNSRISS